MLPNRRRCLALAVLALSLAWTTPSSAQPAPGSGLSDEAEFARAVTLYDSARYPECVTEFRALLGPNGPRKLEQKEIVEKARVYLAACLIATGKRDDAAEQFKEAIRANPAMRAPDSLVFPQTVIDVFFGVRDSMFDEIRKADQERKRKAQEAYERAQRRAAAERARVRKLEEYARRETSITKNRRWVAAVPFGVGQFQNGDPVLGWIFLGTEVALAGTALTALIIETDLNAQSDDNPPPDPVELKEQQDAAHQVMVLSSWGFIGVAVVGIVQAQLAFVPEVREIKRRPLPKDVRPPPDKPEEAWLRPTPLALPGGLGLGVSGRF